MGFLLALCPGRCWLMSNVSLATVTTTESSSQKKVLKEYVGIVLTKSAYIYTRRRVQTCRNKEGKRAGFYERELSSHVGGHFSLY